MEKELELGKSLYKVYFGILYFDKFAGVKNGRSVWKEAFVKTSQFPTGTQAHKELIYLMEVVAPAMGVKVRCYSIETMLVDNIPF